LQGIREKGGHGGGIKGRSGRKTNGVKTGGANAKWRKSKRVYEGGQSRLGVKEEAK